MVLCCHRRNEGLGDGQEEESYLGRLFPRKWQAEELELQSVFRAQPPSPHPVFSRPEKKEKLIFSFDVAFCLHRLPPTIALLRFPAVYTNLFRVLQHQQVVQLASLTKLAQAFWEQNLYSLPLHASYPAASAFPLRAFSSAPRASLFLPFLKRHQNSLIIQYHGRNPPERCGQSVLPSSHCIATRSGWNR